MKRVESSDFRERRKKSLDELEGVAWSPPTFESSLVQTCHRLRKKPIGEFSIEDLRVMIGQNIGLPYLLPLALDVLESNPWVSGDMYPGDLLKMTATADYPWNDERDLSSRARAVLDRALAEIPKLEHSHADGLPNLDVPDEELAEELLEEFEALLPRFH